MRSEKPVALARALTLAGSIAALVAQGCGGGAPPAAPQGPATKPIAAPPPIVVDTSPAPEPEGLLVVGRIKNAEAIIKTVGTWTHLPLPSGADLLRSFDEGVSDAVDLSQPIDGAITISGRATDPKILSAIAVPVRSFDDAKTKLSARHRLTDGPNGGLWIEGIGGKPAREHAESSSSGEEDDDDVRCMLAHGSAGDRVVCGEQEAVDALAPYLARTMPKASWASDFHLEVRTTPLRQYATQMRALVPLVTRGVIGGTSGALGELLDAATGEIVDYVGDTDRMAIDAQVAESGADATVRVTYGHAQSLIAKVATSHPERADAPPAAFMHLPGDADVAFWTRGSDPKIFDHTRELVGKALEDLTSQNGMPEPERKAVKDLVADKMLGLLGDPMIYAKGFDQAALEKALAAAAAAKDTAGEHDARRQVIEQWIGWHLVQVGEPIAKVGPMLKDWSAIWNRPAFAKWAKTRTTQKMLAQMRLAGAPAGVKLPGDSVHLEIVIPRPDVEAAPAPAPSAKGPTPPAPAAKPKLVAQKPVVFHVLAVPDGGATWIGFGLDAKLLATKAAASLASAPDKDTLGKTPAAEALRGSKANGGGFVTLRGVAVFTALEHGRRSPFAMLGSLANKGATPIPVTHVALPPSQDAAGGTSVSTFKLSRPAIEDIARVFLGAAR